jgi:glyoxylase-like metal-dependent hydrolase (beta-lactamase superfamily II)
MTVAKLDILITGYVNEDDEGEHVQPTISLVRSDDVTLVVDPGILASVSDLHDALSTHGLTPDEVTHVFLTHHHVDHTRNVGLFSRAIVIDNESVYRGDIWDDHDGDGMVIANGIKIMHTPGHSDECASLVVDTSEGTAVITHAWWFADRTPEEDPMASDQEQLNQSRSKILEIADYVVPGHGEPVKV